MLFSHNENKQVDDNSILRTSAASDTDFSHSLDDFSEKDITSDTPAKKKKKGFSPAEIAILTVCAAVLIVSSVMLIGNIRDKIRGADIYDTLSSSFDGFTLDDSDGGSELAAAKSSSSDPGLITLYHRLNGEVEATVLDDTTDGAYTAQLEYMRASLSSLYSVNPDIFGWIYVEGTKIDYPVVKSKDNQYYLTHAYTGEPVAVGSIFVDADCGDSLDDNLNTVLYGHNVTSGAMFHDVKSFLNADVFNNSLIYLYTLEGAYIYKPFSAFATESTFQYFRTSFEDTDDFVHFADSMKSCSYVPSDITVGEGDRIITFSTCTNDTTRTGRYAMHAKLIQVIK